MKHLLIFAISLASCGSFDAHSDPQKDFIDRRTHTPHGETGIVIPGVAKGFDEDLLPIIEEYRSFRPAGRPEQKLVAARWVPESVVAKECGNLDRRVIGCCAQHDEGFYISLSQDYRDEEMPDEEAYFRRKAESHLMIIHELGHCIDGLDHLPAGQKGIMQPFIEFGGFEDRWVEMMKKLFN